MSKWTSEVHRQANGLANNLGGSLRTKKALEPNEAVGQICADSNIQYLVYDCARRSTSRNFTDTDATEIISSLGYIKENVHSWSKAKRRRVAINLFADAVLEETVYSLRKLAMK
jgi:hypothetical protein